MIPGVPYDAEIEYLQSNGFQYISILSDPITRSVVRFQFTSLNPKQQRVYVFSSGQSNAVYLNGSGKIAVSWSQDWQGTDIPGLTECIVDSDAETKTTYITRLDTGATVKKVHSKVTLANNIILFDTSASGQGGQYCMRGKIMYAQFYRYGVLMYDLIPVRVGQTGYMYDRVSRKLFGNKTASGFVLGPDVAKPVMGLYGMKISKSIDYTRNGLVALYDGIDNAGYNKHDSNATVWKDLTDNHYDLTSNGTPSWRYNGAYINTKANSFWRSSIPQFRTLWESQNGLFIECICQLGVKFLFSYGGSVPTVESFAAEIKNVNSYRKFFSFISPITTPYFDWPDNTVGRVLAWANQSSYFVGMNSQSSNGTYTYQRKEKYGFGIGCRGDNYGTASANNTIVFRLAVYDHMLTETEIAHNYAIDKARFNLP